MVRPRLTGLLAAATLLLACAHAPPPPAPPPPASAAQVDRILSTPPGTGTWQRLGPGASALLSQAALDAKRPTSERERAVEGLGAVRDPDATPALSKLLADRALSPALRSLVVRALASRDGRAASAELEKALGDRDPAVRAEAARSLGTLGGSNARHALEERLDKETDARVREVLLESLSRAQP